MRLKITLVILLAVGVVALSVLHGKNAAGSSASVTPTTYPQGWQEYNWTDKMTNVVYPCASLADKSGKIRVLVEGVNTDDGVHVYVQAAPGDSIGYVSTLTYKI